MALRVGIEPTTYRLTAGCSTIELPKNIFNQQRPTLPRRLHLSTISAKGLNFCVRYGNRCDPFAIVTGYVLSLKVVSSKLHSKYIFGQVLDLLVSLS